MNDIYLILPGCDDQNRGDQALIWETVDIARKAGYEGTYYMLSSKEKCSQSQNIGIESFDYILKHPSRVSENKNNVKYTKWLKIKWGIVALYDLITKELLLHPCLRKVFRRLYGKQINDSLNMFNQAQKCFVKGGGFLHAYGGVVESYKIYYFLYHIRMALSYGKKVYVMPNSFGPFNAPFVRKMLNDTLSKCEIVMSREGISKEQLQNECKIDSMLFTDIAFHLEAEDTFDSRKVLLEAGVPLGNKICVGITMRPYRFPGENDGIGNYHRYKESIARFITWLNSKDIHPVMIEHVYDEQEHEQDMSCINEVEQLLNEDISYTIFSDRKLICKQMKKIYSEFDYIIGTRFHSVIFALSSYVPAIAITYGGNKGCGIMEDIGLNEYSISISEITFEKLEKMFNSLVKNNVDIQNKLKERIPKIQSEKYKIIRIIKDVK